MQATSESPTQTAAIGSEVHYQSEPMECKETLVGVSDKHRLPFPSEGATRKRPPRFFRTGQEPRGNHAANRKEAVGAS